MAATEQDVRDVTGSTAADAVITPFLTAATNLLGLISTCTASLTDAQVDNAQAYLAAHLLVSSNAGAADRVVESESLAGAYSVKYAMATGTGQGLMATSYGQVANALTNGCLQEIGNRPARLYSLGSHGDS